VPNPARFPTGCKFHPRCPRTRAAAELAGPQDVIEISSGGERFKVLRKCATDEPALREVQRQHWAACHLIDGFEQSPITEPRLEHRREVVPVAIDGGAQRPLATTADANASLHTTPHAAGEVAR
jgi:hypothetical protein